LFHQTPPSSAKPVTSHPEPPSTKPVEFSSAAKPQPIQPWSVQFRNQQSGTGEPPSWVSRLMEQHQHTSQDVPQDDTQNYYQPYPEYSPEETPDDISYPPASSQDYSHYSQDTTPAYAADDAQYPPESPQDDAFDDSQYPPEPASNPPVPAGKFKNISLPQFSNPRHQQARYPEKRLKPAAAESQSSSEPPAPIVSSHSPKPAKKRQSLSGLDLPTFPRYRA
ncbi:MAG: hypothetical protein F6K03_12180, partial [Kamptonema sp. SIO4C4]|nr:hypothetical protein [Kamptonema sp. SIO4C4]